MRTLEKFDLAALAKIDEGRIALAFAKELQRVVNDCSDRPGEKKARTVSLHCTVEPLMDSDGLCEDANIQVQVTSAVPKRKTKKYNMSLNGNHLLFHAGNLEDHRQEVIEFEEED